MQGRRSAEAISVHRTATIFHRDLGSKLKCVIDELSTTGARLRFPVASDIPDTFTISIPCENLNLEVDVRWRGHRECGVEFKESFAHPLLTVHRMRHAAMHANPA
jgi:hypothetical protein